MKHQGIFCAKDPYMAKAKLKAHEYADLFPMMTGMELEALAADIGENGLMNPIVLYCGAILDGRNRLAACEKAGIEPTFSEYDGDDAGALALVISLNVQRRDLTSAQRAIVAARTWMANGDTRDKGKGPRGKDFTSSADTIAKTFKTSKPSITQARDLLTEAPDLAAQVEVCTLSLASAYEELQQRRADAKQKQKDAEKISEYREAISAGEMSIEQAIQKALAAEREQREDENAEADSRRTYLKRLAEIVTHIETFMNHEVGKEGFDGKWFFEDGPGQFDHGLDFDRLNNAGDMLKHVAKHLKGAANGKK